MRLLLVVSWFWLAVIGWAWCSGTSNQRFLLAENEKLLGMARECVGHLNSANDGWGAANDGLKFVTSELRICEEALQYNLSICSGQSRSGGEE